MNTPSSPWPQRPSASDTDNPADDATAVASVAPEPGEASVGETDLPDRGDQCQPPGGARDGEDDEYEPLV